MSLTRQFRLVVPRLQQCLYTTSSSSAGSAGGGAKTDKTVEKTTTKTKEKVPPAPLKSKAESFDNTKYQCNTYYEHKTWTFYDMESQMASRRVGQPSPYKKTS